MRDYLKVYEVTLTTQGPLFVGSGREIMKKEYIIKKDKVIIPDYEKMYYFLHKKFLANKFEDYIMGNDRIDLGDWLKRNNVSSSEISQWTKYELYAGDALMEGKSRMQIMECIKDAYGMPYIPGSSLKGYLRTALLAYEIKKNPNEYNSIKRQIQDSFVKERNGKGFLSKSTKKLEEIAFCKLNRNEKNVGDATNDVLSGLVVSDSNPLTVESLILCQKLEHKIDGSEKTLNLLRECIKPETEIHFKLSIDEGICPYSIENIIEAISNFSKLYNDFFLSKYKNYDRPDTNTIWLGGGAGFVSKTVTYALFRENGVRVVSNIFEKTNVPRNHGHSKDVSYGVSPHILKLSKYGGLKYEFGKCSIDFKQIS